jgi:hypothetical protein
MARELTIVSGGILFYRLFDVAWEIDLKGLDEKLRESRRLSIERKLFSKAFEFANPPVSIRLSNLTATLDGRTMEAHAYAKFYDYGVVSIILDFPARGMSMGEYASLALHLRHKQPLEEYFRTELRRLVEDLKDAMEAVKISPLEEDYTVYHLRALEPALTAEELLAGIDLGELMLAEEGELPPGRARIEELLASRYSYSDRDLVLINWDNALLLEPSASMDIPDLLEFAHAQLLELRVYDQILNKELDAIYASISPGVRIPFWGIKRYEELAARVTRIIAELTEITEKVDNSLKVTEDVYYARIYAAAVNLFKVGQWEDDIRRKIALASRVYDMLYREIANRRTEALEVVIVLLIALEIVLFFFD